jgi:hypothetical protein
MVINLAQREKPHGHTVATSDDKFYGREDLGKNVQPQNV